MPERWLSVSEIAEHLGVSKDTIYNWINDKKIPAHRIGRFWKFKISEVDLTMQENDHSASAKKSKRSANR